MYLPNIITYLLTWQGSCAVFIDLNSNNILCMSIDCTLISFSSYCTVVYEFSCETQRTCNCLAALAGLLAAVGAK